MYDTTARSTSSAAHQNNRFITSPCYSPNKYIYTGHARKKNSYRDSASLNQGTSVPAPPYRLRDRRSDTDACGSQASDVPAAGF